MSKYINDHMFTVGYNPQSGQHFFNLLKHYEKYIHSYFFSFTHSLVGNKYISNQVINDLIRYDNIISY